MNLTEKILKLAEDSGIGDFPLEKQLKLAQGSLKNWRAGKSKPSMDAVLKFANHFNISLDALLERAMPAALAYQIPYEDSNPRGVRFVDGLEGLGKNDIDDIMNYIEFRRTHKSPAAIDAPEGWKDLDDTQKRFIMKLVKDKAADFVAENRQKAANADKQKHG